jgi:hypothetical protein
VGELLVRGGLGDGKGHGGDDFVFRQGAFEEALEEAVGVVLAALGMDGGPQRDEGGGVVGRRVRVGDGAAEGAAVAHLGVADIARQRGQGGDRSLHLCGRRDLGVGGRRADHQRIAFAPNALKLRDARQGDELGREGEVELHHGEQALAPAQKLGFVVVRQDPLCGREVAGSLVFEGLHGGLLAGEDALGVAG